MAIPDAPTNLRFEEAIPTQHGLMGQGVDTTDDFYEETFCVSTPYFSTGTLNAAQLRWGGVGDWGVTVRNPICAGFVKTDLSNYSCSLWLPADGRIAFSWRYYNTGGGSQYWTPTASQMLPNTWHELLGNFAYNTKAYLQERDDPSANFVTRSQSSQTIRTPLLANGQAKLYSGQGVCTRGYSRVSYVTQIQLLAGTPLDAYASGTVNPVITDDNGNTLTGEGGIYIGDTYE